MKAITLFLIFISLLRGEEIIQSYKSHIIVNSDGWLDITETIKVNVEGSEISRGIYRDFPQTYLTKWGFRERRPIQVLSVTRNEESEDFEVDQIKMGTRILIGSKYTLLPEDTVQEYKVKYRTRYQLITGVGGVDELNWNVTGNEWGFKIAQIEAVVELPDDIVMTKSWAWTGKQGDQGEDYTSNFEGNSANFQSTRVMQWKEGMTIIVQWPTGLLENAAYGKPSIYDDNSTLITGMILVGVSVILYLVMWFLVGRDPPRGVIIPRWEPPGGFTPGDIRFLKNLCFDDQCFSAGLLGLASQGCLKLEESDGVYTVIKVCAPPVDDPVSHALFSKLFQKTDELVLSPVNHQMVGGTRKYYEKVLKVVINQRYFCANFGAQLPGMIVGIGGVLFTMISSPNPAQTFTTSLILLVFGFISFQFISTIVLSAKSRVWEGVWSKILAWSVAALPLGIGLLMFGYYTGRWASFSFLVAYATGVLFYYLMKQPTERGRQIMDEIEGFRDYLKVAEEDRLNLENPPEKTPELFEKFLPYALALDVEQEWSKKFDEILQAAGQAPGESGYRPRYYTGDFSATSQALTGAALGGALTSALTTSSSRPSSSSSSGGGSSGGGGGGGGGGGW